MKTARPRYTADEDNIIMQEYHKNKSSMTMEEIANQVSSRLDDRNPKAILKRMYKLRLMRSNNGTQKFIRKPMNTKSGKRRGAERRYFEDDYRQLHDFVATYPDPNTTGISDILEEYAEKNDIPSGTIRGLFYSHVITEIGDPRLLWDDVPEYVLNKKKRGRDAMVDEVVDSQPNAPAQPTPSEALEAYMDAEEMTPRSNVAISSGRLVLPITKISIQGNSVVIDFDLPNAQSE